MNVTRRFWYLAGVILLAVLADGCATTRVTSQVNPEVAGRSFVRVLVQGDFKNFEHRRLAEEKLCTELASTAGCTCLKSSEVFFPGQKYSAEQIVTRIRELQIDAVLTLRPIESGTSSIYVPPTLHTKGSATVIGDTVIGSSTTKIEGGYNIRLPWANYEAVLLSTSDGKVAWYATAASNGGASAMWSDLIISASSETVSKLISDGVFRKLKE